MTQKTSFAMYDSFSEKPFGGSQACVVSGAANFSADLRERIAKEFGMPATAFVSSVDDGGVSARFLSTVMELPMCGHGTVALMTHLIQEKAIPWNGTEAISVPLHLPRGTAQVDISPREDGRPLVMLKVGQPRFRVDNLDMAELCSLMGLSRHALNADLPVETITADFVHLAVPVYGLDEMRRIKPDFGGMVRFCHRHKIETLAVFCLEVETPGNTLHVRDFCPAVGVPESAAAGTTNAALANYLYRHGIVRADAAGHVQVKAEQGIEIRRPSEVRSLLTLASDQVVQSQVGGVAARVIEGQLRLP